MIQREPVWVTLELAQAIHDRQLAEHGGLSGTRDQGMFESAIARPRQLYSYGVSNVDMPALAASYAFGLARNHPFADGNKRTAYVVCRTFLVLNGWDIIGSLSDRYAVFLALAAGELSEQDLANWLREQTRPEQVSEDQGQYA